MDKIAKKGNWEVYKGWSQFEKEFVLEPYLTTVRKVIKLHEAKEIVAVGIGPGFPENLLIGEGVSVFGIDNNTYQLERAKKLGIETFLSDVFDIKNNKDLCQKADVVTAPFLVHNIEPEKMDELYKNFAYLLKPEGVLITLDPHASYEHIQADDNSTYREVLNMDGNAIKSEDVSPKNDSYLIRITLDSGMENESVIINKHRPLSSYISSMENAGFDEIVVKDVGYQSNKEGVEFPAYQIITGKLS